MRAFEFQQTLLYYNISKELISPFFFFFFLVVSVGARDNNQEFNNDPSKTKERRVEGAKDIHRFLFDL